MSTSEVLAVRAGWFGAPPDSREFRDVSTRNFPGRHSFSARRTVIDTTARITSIRAQVAAGLGREVPACQF